MSRTRTRSLGSVVLAVTLVFAAGCGSSSKTSTAPNTPEQRKFDKALGKQAVLKLADLPVGYKATPHKNDPSTATPESAVREFASCAHVPKARVASLLNGKADPKEVEVDSSDFANKDVQTGYSTTFENSVDLERSSKDVTGPFDTFTARTAHPCWKELFHAIFEDSADPGTAIRNVAVTPISTGKIADKSAGLAVRLTVVGKARSVNAYIDVYLVCSGRAGISLVATGIGERADSSLALSLVQTVADRLKGTT